MIDDMTLEVLEEETKLAMEDLVSRKLDTRYEDTVLALIKEYRELLEAKEKDDEA